MLSNLALGFSVALSFEAIMYCFLGVALGTLMGVLPGVGALAAIALLLPLTFHLDPTVAIIMLAGIWYGTQYGGSTAAILLNLPGTPAAAVAALDGYPMSKQGRAGVALFMTTIASLVGSMFGIVLVAAFAPALGAAAVRFGSPDYFAVMVLGLLAAAVLTRGSPIKGMAMVVLGLLLGLVGMDITSGERRFTFGQYELFDGLTFVAVAMGIFGISEVIANAGRLRTRAISAREITWKSMLPSRDDVQKARVPMVRGSVIGMGFGVLPGAGPAIASFMSYATEKKLAKDPSRFGRGAVEGVSAPEAANNAAAQSAFVPTLSLGIPGDAAMAMMLGALMLHGIVPGPSLITEHATLFWGLVASFFIGNILLVILNIPLIGVWVRILAIPYHILYPIILALLCIGVFSINNSLFEVKVALIFGVVGYGMILFRFEPAPLLLGLILAPLLEENLTRSLILSRGDPMIFFQRPISATFLVIAMILLLRIVWGALRRRMKETSGDPAAKEG